MAKSIQTAKIGVTLDANTVSYLNNLKKAQMATEERLGKIEGMYESAAGAGEKLNKSGGKVTKGFKLQKNAAGQLGFQLQDVAVQAQMGTSWFTILAQQGSQLAGVLGPNGALLGAVIAIGGAIGGVLYKALTGAGDKIPEFTADIKKLGENLEAIAEMDLSQSQKALLSDKAADQYKQASRQIAEYREEYQEMLGVLKSGTILSSVSTGMNTYTTRVKLGEEALKTYNLQAAQLLANIQEMNKAQKMSSDIMDILAGKQVVTAKTLKENAKAVRESIDALKDQLIQLSLSEKAYAVREARILGATSAQVAEIEAYYDGIEAIEAQKKAEKDAAAQKKKDLADEARIKKQAQAQAGRVIADDPTVTEFDRIAAEEEQMKSFREQDLISEETYQKALQALRRKYKDEERKVLESEVKDDAAKLEEKLRKEEEAEMRRRQLMTDTYEFKKNQDLTAYEELLLDKERELQLLEQQHADQIRMHADNAEALAMIDQRYKIQKNNLDKRLQHEKTEIMFGDLDNIAAAFGEELKLAQTYAKLQLITSQAIAFGKAYELGFPAYIPQLLSLGSSFAGLIGQFHGGTDEVPSTMNNKSFLLKAGERVVQPEANKSLTGFLKDYKNGGGVGGGATSITAPMTIQGNVTDEAWFQAQLGKHNTTILAAVNKANRDRPSRKNRGRTR